MDNITQIQFRRDQAINWASVNPILALGEPGLELDATNTVTGFKIGDGVTAWNDLAYQSGDFEALEARVVAAEQDINTIENTTIPGITGRLDADEQGIHNNSIAIQAQGGTIGAHTTSISQLNSKVTNLTRALDDEVLARQGADGILDNKFLNYYTKSETYTKAEVNSALSTIPKYSTKVVQELPEENISTSSIYLVPQSREGQDDLYTEYVYVNNGTELEPDWEWEKLGTQELDLSGYQKTLTAGTGISITQEENQNPVISSTLTAGTNVSINETTINGKTVQQISATNTTYTAGENITISDQNVISAQTSGTTYTAGNGISIESNVISSVIPEPPQELGVYSLMCAVLSGGPTYMWVEDGSIIFSFTIDSNTYNAFGDTTWGNWVEIPLLNTAGFTVEEVQGEDDTSHYITDSNGNRVLYEGTPVLAEDVIIEDGEYTCVPQPEEEPQE